MRKPSVRKPSASAGSATANNLVAAVRKKVTGTKERIGVLSTGEVTLPEINEWIPTGFPSLDWMLGGGYPVGRITEAYGPEASGKSALMHCGLRACQQMGGTAVWFDFEQDLAMKERIVGQLGLDESNLIYARPDYLEEGLSMLRALLGELIKNPPAKPTFIGWDSVAFSRTKAQVDNKDDHKAKKAAIWTDFFEWVTYEVVKARAHLFFVNQVRTNVGAGMFEPSEKTPGGWALKFAATLRLRCWSKKIIREISGKKTVIGLECSVNSRKNKSAYPFQIGQWTLDFKHGPSPELTMLRILTDAKLTKNVQGWIKVPWSQKKIRAVDWVAYIREDPEAEAALRVAVQEVLADL
jgi:recombination protein RecA